MAPDAFRVQRLDHVHLFASDRAAAARWYGDVLGLTTHYDYAQHGDPGGPLVLSSDDGATHIAVFQAQGALRREGHDHMVAFRVDGAGFLTFLDRLERLAVHDESRARVGRADVVDHGNSHSIYFRDLDGNPLELTTYDHDFVARRLGAG
jgi:catechol 2,3-dioxygenase-like lactoylglutathione lyase family enzyme